MPTNTSNMTSSQDDLMISVENVERTYVTGVVRVRALRGVSLTVDQGEFLSIAGPSGSGKTTLLNLIGCLDKPDVGNIGIDGARVADMN